LKSEFSRISRLILPKPQDYEDLSNRRIINISIFSQALHFGGVEYFCCAILEVLFIFLFIYFKVLNFLKKNFFLATIKRSTFWEWISCWFDFNFLSYFIYFY